MGSTQVPQCGKRMPGLKGFLQSVLCISLPSAEEPFLPELAETLPAGHSDAA